VLANQYFSIPLAGAIGQTLCNLVEVLLAAYLIRRLMRNGSPLQSLRGVSGLLLAIALGTLASAIIGPLSLLSSGALPSHELQSVARTWWLADASGALIVVPFALAWFTSVPRVRVRPFPALVVLCAVAVSAWLSTRGDQALTYLAFPVLVIAAIRFGSRVATTAVVVTAALAIRATTHYEGPFSYTSISHSVLVTQLFIAVSAISVLYFVGLVFERELAGERLIEARLDVARAEYLERHRIERNLHDGVQQRMLALLIQLKSAEQLDAPAPVHEALERAEHEVRTAMEELRELARGTFPPVLTEVGLGGAIQEIAAQSVVPIEVLEVPAERCDLAVEAAAYYVVAETVTNAQKHASPTVIHIRVSTADHALSVQVADDGVGGASETAGSGLAGLRERIESFGGTFELTSPQDGGTQIRALIPRGAASV